MVRDYRRSSNASASDHTPLWLVLLMKWILHYQTKDMMCLNLHILGSDPQERASQKSDWLREGSTTRNAEGADRHCRQDLLVTWFLLHLVPLRERT